MNKYKLALAGLLTIALLACTKPRPNLEVKLSSLPLAEGVDRYSLNIKNNGNTAIAFQVADDKGFSHEACTQGILFPMTILRWNEAQKSWEERKTIVSGMTTSVKASGMSGTHTVMLQPNASFCAGWWHDYEAVDPGDRLKLKVCTSFEPSAQCFTSEEFSPRRGGS
jgi:hypothetical protein